MMNFDIAFDRLIGHEGGYVNDSRDPGGETKYGISKRAYPDVDIKALTLEQARTIYRRDWWDRLQIDSLPEAIRFPMFDAAVNSGPGNAARWLQRAAGVADDGRIGPVTIAAVKAANPEALAARMHGHRLRFMTQLTTWPTFGRGWAVRVAENLIATEG